MAFFGHLSFCFCSVSSLCLAFPFSLVYSSFSGGVVAELTSQGEKLNMHEKDSEGLWDLEEGKLNI